MSEQPNRHLSHKDFRITLVRELLTKYSEMNEFVTGTRSHHKSLPPPTRLIERHFPDKNHLTPAGKPSQLNCQVCSGRRGNGHKTTIYRCNECDIALCIVPCFRLYHTYTDPTRYI